jgi:hypothetical protein
MKSETETKQIARMIIPIVYEFLWRKLDAFEFYVLCIMITRLQFGRNNTGATDYDAEFVISDRKLERLAQVSSATVARVVGRLIHYDILRQVAKHTYTLNLEWFAHYGEAFFVKCQESQIKHRVEL